MFDFSTALSYAQQSEKAATSVRDHALAKALAPVVEDVLTTEGVKPSKTSAWVGVRVDVPVTIDGRTFTASLTLSDVAATEARKPGHEAAKKYAEEHKVAKGKDMTAFMTVAMRQVDEALAATAEETTEEDAA